MQIARSEIVDPSRMECANERSRVSKSRRAHVGDCEIVAGREPRRPNSASWYIRPRCWPGTSLHEVPAFASSRRTLGRSPRPTRRRSCSSTTASRATRPSSRRWSTSRRSGSSRLTFPGFGASEKPDPQRYAYGWDAFADSIADLVAGLGLGRVHVCGHAMGGGVALALAARHPALVHKLVLVDALVYPIDEHVLERAGPRAARRRAALAPADGSCALPDVRRGVGLCRLHGRAGGPRRRLLRVVQRPGGASGRARHHRREGRHPAARRTPPAGQRRVARGVGTRRPPGPRRARTPPRAGAQGSVRGARVRALPARRGARRLRRGRGLLPAVRQSCRAPSSRSLPHVP